MPKQGFKVITINEQAVNRFEKYLKNNKSELRMKGVSSMASLLEYAYAKMDSEKKSASVLASKIKIIPLTVKMYTLPNMDG